MQYFKKSNVRTKHPWWTEYFRILHKVGIWSCPLHPGPDPVKSSFFEILIFWASWTFGLQFWLYKYSIKMSFVLMTVWCPLPALDIWVVFSVHSTNGETEAPGGLASVLWSQSQQTVEGDFGGHTLSPLRFCQFPKSVYVSGGRSFSY